MLSVDSGIGAFTYDTAYGPMTRDEWIGQYDLQNSFPITDFHEDMLANPEYLQWQPNDILMSAAAVQLENPTITLIGTDQLKEGSGYVTFKITYPSVSGSTGDSRRVLFRVVSQQSWLTPTFTLEPGSLGTINREGSNYSVFVGGTSNEVVTFRVSFPGDTIPRDTAEFKLELYQKYHNGQIAPQAIIYHDFNSMSAFSPTITVKDNDHWKITSQVIDDIALEPCTWLSVDDRIGSYNISKTPGDANCNDNSYPITVEFELTGTATPGNYGSGNNQDYQLFVGDRSNWNNSSSYISLSTVNGKTTGKVTIPAGQNSVTVNLIAMTDSIFETDETAKLIVTRAYSTASLAANKFFEIGPTGGAVTILQAPEFISQRDEDPLPERIPINADYWNLPKKYEKMEEGTVVIEELTCVKNRPVRYSIIEGNDNGVFRIDENTGKITFTTTPNDWIWGNFTLKVRVEDRTYSKLYDEATVSFGFGYLAEFYIYSRAGTSTWTEIITGQGQDFGHSYFGLTFKSHPFEGAILFA